MHVKRMQMHPGTLFGGHADVHFYVRMHPSPPRRRDVVQRLIRWSQDQRKWRAKRSLKADLAKESLGCTPSAVGDLRRSQNVGGKHIC